MSRTFHINTKLVKNSDGEAKLIHLHSSSSLGGKIVHAATGFALPGILGSKDEAMFFKLQYVLGDQIPYHTPLTLFYYSPEDAERHLETRFQEKTKELFRQRFV